MNTMKNASKYFSQIISCGSETSRPQSDFTHANLKSRRCRGNKAVLALLIGAMVVTTSATTFAERVVAIQAYDRTYGTMETADTYVERIKAIKGDLRIANGVELNREAAKVFANQLEEEFQTKLKELITDLSKKEKEVKKLQKYRKYKTLSKPEQWNLEEYLGRADALKKRLKRGHFKLAQPKWGKLTGRKNKFKAIATRGNNTIRQGHLNCLAIGLSDETSGFSAGFRDGAKKFEFIQYAKKLGCIGKHQNKREDGDYADMLSAFLNVSDGSTVPREKLNAKKAGYLDEFLEEIYDKTVEIAINEADFYKRLGRLCKKYYAWSCQNKVPQEEMNLLLSNSDPNLMENGALKGETKPIDGNTIDNVRITRRIGRILTMVLREELEVMTLVELDSYTFFAKILGELGYDGTFQQKNRSERQRSTRTQALDRP